MGRDAEYMVMWHDRQLSFFRRTKNFGIDFVYFVFWDIFALKLVCWVTTNMASRGEPKICILSHKESGTSNPTLKSTCTISRAVLRPLSVDTIYPSDLLLGWQLGYLLKLLGWLNSSGF